MRALTFNQKIFLRELAKEGKTTVYDLTTEEARILVNMNDYETCLQDAERFLSDIYFAIAYGKEALWVRGL